VWSIKGADLNELPVKVTVLLKAKPIREENLLFFLAVEQTLRGGDAKESMVGVLSSFPGPPCLLFSTMILVISSPSPSWRHSP